MEILVPSIPKRLIITPWMIEDFIRDPVLGARVILGREYDTFQAVRMRYYWHVREVIDSSGVSTLKTGVFWDFVNLRCALIADQLCGVFYQTFATGKKVFWAGYNRRYNSIFAAQLGEFKVSGEEAGKANTRGASCFHQHFRNGSEVQMPAPSWGKEAASAAGTRFNVMGFDEWTKTEAMRSQEKLMEPGGINKQMLLRLTREIPANRSKNQPIWGNHIIFLATAEHPAHPAYTRYYSAVKRAASGDPTVAVISFNYKHYSDKMQKSGISFKGQYREDAAIEMSRAAFTADHFRREVLGIWSAHGKGVYNSDFVRQAIEIGMQRGLEIMTRRNEVTERGIYSAGTSQASESSLRNKFRAPELERPNLELIAQTEPAHFFLGNDPAALGKSDAALVVGRATPLLPGVAGHQPGDWKFDFVWGYKMSKASVDQASGLIHKKHGHFHFAGVNVDAGAGGQGPSIMLKLKDREQKIDSITTLCKPICCPDDMTDPNADFILTFFKRGDVTVEGLWPSFTMAGDESLWHNSHVAFVEAFEHGIIGLPVPFNERPAGETRDWLPEKQWALKVISQGIEQLQKIYVLLKDDGTWLMARGAPLYRAAGKKDIAYAMLMCYVRFLIWLKGNQLEGMLGPSDGEMCSTF